MYYVAHKDIAELIHWNRFLSSINVKNLGSVLFLKLYFSGSALFGIKRIVLSQSTCGINCKLRDFTVPQTNYYFFDML
jgi:hypothetical protein